MAYTGAGTKHRAPTSTQYHLQYKPAPPDAGPNAKPRLSIIPHNKAFQTYLTAFLNNAPAPYTTIYIGSYEDCQNHRASLDASYAAAKLNQKKIA